MLLTEGDKYPFPVIGEGCNVCRGTGKAKDWFNPPYEGDIQPVSFVLSRPEPVIPFALVTPDGEWHEKGEMGWFGFARNEKDDDEWAATVTQLLNEHKDCNAVVVDCHI